MESQIKEAISVVRNYNRSIKAQTLMLISVVWRIVLELALADNWTILDYFYLSLFGFFVYSRSRNVIIAIALSKSQQSS